MSNDVIQRYIAEGIRALEHMAESSRRGNEISQELLMRLIRDNAVITEE